MKWMVVLLVASLALSGCGKKDPPSDASLEADMDAALARVIDDLGPDGAINGADLVVPYATEFATIGVPLTLTIAPDGAMRLDGRIQFGSAQVTIAAYCNQEILALVTEGSQSFDPEAEDISIEARNQDGSCTTLDEGAAELLGGFAIVLRLLSDTEPLQLIDITYKDGVIDGTYADAGSPGTVQVLVKNDRILRISASADEGQLTFEPTYGDRSAVTPVEADERVPSPVVWTSNKGRTAGDPGSVTIYSGESAIDEHHLRIYPSSDVSSIGCTSAPEPVMVFDLADGLTQEKDGFDMVYHDDGDGLMDDGDKITLWHPERIAEPWPYHVEIWDAWSDTSADALCSIPGPSAAMIGVGLIALVGLRRRR